LFYAKHPATNSVCAVIKSAIDSSSGGRAMIPVKQAVKIAFELLNDLYDAKKFADVMLEEVERSEDGKVWLITVSFSRQIPSENIMEAIGSRKYARSFKLFQISADTGEMVSMKNCVLKAREAKQ
jgi:hypothetical protein